jgi:hypothetical protein
MGSVTRRMHRQAGRKASRKVDEIVERVLTGLDELEDEACDQRDEEAYGACQ